MATLLDLLLPEITSEEAWTRFELVATAKNGVMTGRNQFFPRSSAVS